MYLCEYICMYIYQDNKNRSYICSYKYIHIPYIKVSV